MFRYTYVSFIYTCLCLLSKSYFIQSELSDEEPLILTPLIKEGRIHEARSRSMVKPLLPNIYSNSGYFTVNETTNSNLFFWFFQKTANDWQNVPVILWLQGGPGCSSLYGLFAENGPYQFSKNNKLRRRKYAWTNEYNVLYIDNPIGTGYSFTNNYYVKTEMEIGLHLYDALVQFFQLYPKLRGNDFFISGESYAGKYIPALAYTIYNKNPNCEQRINLKGLFIGNGFMNPESMTYAPYLHKLGLIDFRTKLFIESMESKEKFLIRNGLWTEAFYERRDVLRAVRNITEFRTLYDYTREDIRDGDAYKKFIQTNEIRKAIHVGKTNFSSYAQVILDNLRDDICQSVKHWVEELLEYYPIMLFSGQLDIIVAHQLTSDFINELHWSDAMLFSQKQRKKWYFENQLVGYYKIAGNLKEALIRSASHMVPSSKPKVILDLLRRFINDDFE